jgi:hypothetical protein
MMMAPVRTLQGMEPRDPIAVSAGSIPHDERHNAKSTNAGGIEYLRGCAAAFEGFE